VRGYKPAHWLVCLDVGPQFGQVQAGSLPLKCADRITSNAARVFGSR
jgi:hypothetical protein